MNTKAKTNLKRTLAVFLTLLMLLSCFPAGMSVLAASLDSSVPDRTWKTANSASATSSLYGMPVWTGDRDTGYINWERINDQDADNLYVTYPSHIYMDVSENLADTGYKVHVTGHYGNSGNYKYKVSGLIWGEATASGLDSRAYTMDSLFNGYSHQATATGTRRDTDYFDNSDSLGGNTAVTWRCRDDLDTTNNDYDEYVFLTGAPRQTTSSDVTYSTSGWDHEYFITEVFKYMGVTFQDTNSRTKTQATSASCIVDGYKEIEMTVTIYDKSQLNYLISLADAGKMSPAPSAATLSEAKDVLTNRYVTQDDINAAVNSFGDDLTRLIGSGSAAYDANTDYTAALTKTGSANVFDAQAYHEGDVATGAYSNLVYAPIYTTSWSGDGAGNNYIGIGRQNLKIATPRNVVMVYDGAHDVYAPVELESVRNQSSGDKQLIHYIGNYSSIYTLRQDWAGFNTNYSRWVPDTIETADSFAYYDNNNYNETSQNMNNTTTRFWWNRVYYSGTGNTSTYFDHESNLKYYGKTSYKESTGSRQYKYGDVISITDYYTLNYEPVYSALDEAKDAYTELVADEWMYTEASVNRVKATIYQMVQANPKNSVYDYSNTSTAVTNCANAIKDAVTLLGSVVNGKHEGLTLVKKTGAVTFYNADETVNAILMADYGEDIAAASIPTATARTDTAQYSYSNPVWEPTLADYTDASGNIYMADAAGTTKTGNPTTDGLEFHVNDHETVNQYTVTFVDYDGTELDSATLDYGETPTPPDGPTRESSVSTVYTFAGWKETDTNVEFPQGVALAAVSGDMTYQAYYTEAPRKYGITWVYTDDDGVAKNVTEQVAYGTTPTAPALTGYQTTDKVYTFTGWDNEIVSVTGAATYTAQYSNVPREYAVTWVYTDDSGTAQNVTEQVAYDTLPTAPTLTGYQTTDKVYTFTGWNTEIAKVTADVTYTAQYSFAPRKYTITWTNEDDSLIDTTEVEYGAVPTHADASKAATAEYTYAFKAWTPEVVAVTGEATYKASFTASKNSYEIKFIYKNAGGVEQTDTSTIEYGETPTAPAAPDYQTVDKVYTFANWDSEIGAVTGTKTYTATYTETPRKYTVTWSYRAADGTLTSATEEVAYNDTATAPTLPEVKTTELVYTFTGWNPTPGAVTEDVTYAAQYMATPRKYTVTWNYKNDSGDTSTAAEIAYNGTATPPTETSYTDGDYNYVVSGWTPEITAVTGDVEYTAIYKVDKSAALSAAQDILDNDDQYDDAYIAQVAAAAQALENADADDDAAVKAAIDALKDLTDTKDSHKSFMTEWAWVGDDATGYTAASVTVTYSDSTTETLAATVEKATAKDAADITYDDPGTIVYTATTTDAVNGSPLTDSKTVAITWNAGALTRPTTKGGNDGYYTYTATQDSAITATVPVDGAEYEAYDAAVAALEAMLDRDLIDTIKSQIRTVLSENAVADDRIESEQLQVNAAAQALQAALSSINETIASMGDTAYNQYTLTVTDNLGSESLTVTKPAGGTYTPAAKDGYKLVGFTAEHGTVNADLTYTFVQSNDTAVAYYALDVDSTLAAAQAILDDAANTSTGADYESSYISELQTKTDQLNAAKNNPDKNTEAATLKSELETLIADAENHKTSTSSHRITFTYGKTGSNVVIGTYNNGSVVTPPANTSYVSAGFTYTVTYWTTDGTDRYTDGEIPAATGNADYTAVYTIYDLADALAAIRSAQAQANKVSAEDTEKIETVIAQIDALFTENGVRVQNHLTVLENPIDTDTAEGQAFVSDLGDLLALLQQTVDETVTLCPDGHDFIYYDMKPATCTEDGYTAYRVCRNCGTTISYEVLPATGHSDEYEPDVVRSGKLADGSASWTTYTCKNGCGDYYLYLTYTVLDSNSKPVANATVKVNVDGTELTGTTNANGVVEFTQQLTEGEYALTVAAGDTTLDGTMRVHNGRVNVAIGKIDGGSSSDNNTDTGAFRCPMCNAYDELHDVPVLGWFITIVHYFIHMAYRIINAASNKTSRWA